NAELPSQGSHRRMRPASADHQRLTQCGLSHHTSSNGRIAQLSLNPLFSVGLHVPLRTPEPVDCQFGYELHTAQTLRGNPAAATLYCPRAQDVSQSFSGTT